MENEIKTMLKAINKMNTKTMNPKELKKLINIKNELKKQLIEEYNKKNT